MRNEQQFCIQILDESSGEISFFDRMKLYNSNYRVITSKERIKYYTCRVHAELDFNKIKKYYKNNCLIEIVECGK